LIKSLVVLIALVVLITLVKLIALITLVKLIGLVVLIGWVILSLNIIVSLLPVFLLVKSNSRAKILVCRVANISSQVLSLKSPLIEVHDLSQVLWVWAVVLVMVFL